MLRNLIDSETKTKNSQQFPFFKDFTLEIVTVINTASTLQAKILHVRYFFKILLSISLKMAPLELKSVDKC
jgi:hypothetical protein